MLCRLLSLIPSAGLNVSISYLRIHAFASLQTLTVGAASGRTRPIVAGRCHRPVSHQNNTRRWQKCSCIAVPQSLQVSVICVTLVRKRHTREIHQRNQLTNRSMVNGASSQMYQQPPITEAVIGIDFNESIEEAALSGLQNRFSGYYPNHQSVESINFKVEIDAGAGSPKTVSSKEIGHRLSTSDLTELLVLLPKTFTFSQLAPYPGWSVFFERFVRDWKIYKRDLGFRSVRRIGVRYINRIDIPIENEIVEHEKYLGIYPNITDKFGPLSAYSVNAEIFMKDLECQLRINSAAVPSPILGYASFLIDQDIFREINVPQRDEDILDLIEKIRLKKNEVFESCITDHARVLFEHGT